MVRSSGYRIVCSFVLLFLLDNNHYYYVEYYDFSDLPTNPNTDLERGDLIHNQL